MEAIENTGLIHSALNGDKQAYGRLVEKYQALVCSLTYSACGDFAQSEDLAQETFITAWKKLKDLKDLSKFKAWLCGIARNITNNRLRRKKTTKALDSIQLEAEEAVQPDEQAISKEEETLVWSSLEILPQKYRDPLVLFYRKDQSLAQVAEDLDLSMDAAKKRLSRGRSMLKDKIAQLVENSLTKTGPKKVFAIAVVSSLPSMAAEAATAGAALTKGAAVSTGWLGALLGPICGIMGGYLGARASINNARSLREKELLKKMSWMVMGITLVFTITLVLMILLRKHTALLSASQFAYGLCGLILAHVSAMVFYLVRTSRAIKRIFEEDRDSGDLYPHVLETPPKKQGVDYRSKLQLMGLPLIHVAFGKGVKGEYKRGIAKAWVAIGDVSFGVLFSAGGIAFGGVAFGGVAFGGICLGGVALGGLAFGGLALGWIALGGMAIAWHCAYGGLAIAMEYAYGGAVYANEVNREAIKEMMERNIIFNAGKFLMDHSRWALLFLLWPIYLNFKRARKQS